MKKNTIYTILLTSLITASIIGRVFIEVYLLSKILAILVIIFAFINIRVFIYPKIINYYLAFIIWCGFSSIFIGANLEAVYTILYTLVQIYVFIFFTYNLALREINFNKIGIVFIITTLIIMFAPLIGINNPVQQDIGRYQGLTINSNFFGLYVNYFIISIFYFYLKYKKNIFYTTILIILLITGLYFILISGSRTSLFVFISAIVVFLFYQRILSPALVLYIAIFLILYLTFFDLIFSYILDSSLFKRIVNDSIMLNSADIRVANIRYAWNVFLENPIAGVGLENFKFKNPLKLMAHNYYLELLASTGLIGFFIIFSIYFKLGKLSVKALKNKHLRDEGIFAILFLSVTFVYSFAFHLYDSMDHWIFLSIIYAVINSKESRVDKNSSIIKSHIITD